MAIVLLDWEKAFDKVDRSRLIVTKATPSSSHSSAEYGKVVSYHLICFYL